MGWSERWHSLRGNHEILRSWVDRIGREYERKSYEEILADPVSERAVTLAGGVTIHFSIEVYARDGDGTICCCIDARGLPTLGGVKPSYHFCKRSDGSVHY